MGKKEVKDQCGKCRGCGEVTDDMFETPKNRYTPTMLENLPEFHYLRPKWKVCPSCNGAAKRTRFARGHNIKRHKA